MAGAIPEQPATLLARIDREAHDWVVRFAVGNAGRADLDAFRKWSQDAGCVEAFSRACRLWEAVGPASMPVVSPEALQRGAGMGRRAFMGGALAASVAATAYVGVRAPLGLWPSWTELGADHRTAPGEQRRVALAGGPSIELNTRTSIALRPSAGGGAERIELFGGEAAIEARPDRHRAIEVVAGDGRVTATDAAFNLRYEHDVACTTCIAGALEVAVGGRSVDLRPGAQVTYSGGALGAVVMVDVGLVTAWKHGILVFRSTPLAEAVAEINRYRSGRIFVTNAALGRRLFNARFPIAHVDGVVRQIQQAFGASVTTLPGGIVLLG